MVTSTYSTLLFKYESACRRRDLYEASTDEYRCEDRFGELVNAAHDAALAIIQAPATDVAELAVKARVIAAEGLEVEPSAVVWRELERLAAA